MVGLRFFLVLCVLCAVEPAELTDTNTRDDVDKEDGVQVLEQVVHYLNPKSRRSIEQETSERCTATGSYCSWCLCKCCSGRCLEDNTMGLGFASRCVPWTQCLEQAARNANKYCRQTRL
ncbi:uncharacterized protein [Branchiostoma lanceolatum]|uniref:uncharacterized protein n=1 Tax=Branchiostoma lanceolatum TaxID=7740 RepID=UPI0034511D04